jgi:hypothetical protein
MSTILISSSSLSFEELPLRAEIPDPPCQLPSQTRPRRGSPPNRGGDYAQMSNRAPLPAGAISPLRLRDVTRSAI